MNAADAGTPVIDRPVTPSELLQRAFACHQADECVEAERLYRQVLQAEDTNLNALQLLGALVGRDGRSGESIALLERAAAVLQASGDATAQHAALYYNLGNALKTVGRRIDAIDSYRRGLALDPDLAALHASLAAELLNQGEHAAAAAAFEAALRLVPTHPEWLHSLGITYAAMDRTQDAIVCYHQALACAPDQTSTLRALVLAYLSLDRAADTMAPLSRLAQLVASGPNDPVALTTLGKLQFVANSFGPARYSFERAVALRPDDAESHTMLGRIHYAAGDIDAAEHAYRQALLHEPGQIEALFQLGLLLQSNRRLPVEAIALYERLIAVAPGHAEVYAALGNACSSLMQIDRALMAFRRYLKLAPDSAAAHFHLGWALCKAGQNSEALPYLGRAISLDHPRVLTHLAHILRGNALQQLGCIADSHDEFRLALHYEPVTTLTVRPGGEKAAFSVLLILAPGQYNTPYEYLTQQDVYDANILLLLPDFDYDIALLQSRCDIVVNLVSDADVDRAILPLAASLIDRLAKPVINKPGRILSTDRESTATVLSGIPHCRVASISRHPGSTLLAADVLTRPDMPALPFLTRCTGLHNGDEFEMINGVADLHALVGRKTDADYFVIQYLDYQSPDGFYRKYRFFFIDGLILPYHLAISEDWKVHHVSTDMVNQGWMKQEEAAFLDAPDTVFGAQQMATLQAIRAAVGLEFFGIDCSVDQDGNVVVFEANATMLVHGHTAEFPYRDKHVRRIKDAFNAMLTRMQSA